MAENELEKKCLSPSRVNVMTIKEYVVRLCGSFVYVRPQMSFNLSKAAS